MKISVIVPVYNAEPFLKKCLTSVINQTYSNWEVIAIDDGSLDNSYQILREFACKDSRFIISSKINEGPGLTRNKALKLATGDIIVFLDSDDYIEEDYFELLVEKVVNDRADVVFIDLIQEKTDGTLIKEERMSLFKNRNKHDLLGCQMTGYMPWGGVRKAAVKSIINNNKLCYTADPVGEEAIFSFELVRNATVISFIEKGLYHYVNHPGSQSKIPNGTWVTTLRKMKNHLIAKGLYDKYNVHVSSFAFVVMISWLLSYAKNHTIKNTFDEFGKKRKEYFREYKWNVNMNYLRKEVRVLYPLVRMNILLPVVIAAKIVKK